MDSSLHEVWAAAKGNEFFPSVDKPSQFFVGITLLILGLFAAGVFTINRSIVNIVLLGFPAAIALGFSVVYMFCAVGVYV